jgi:hypothetical protein
MRKITICIWSDKKNQTKYEDIGVIESDTLLSLIQRNKKKLKIVDGQQYVYAWIERKPGKSDIENTLAELFTDTFFITKVEFERRFYLKYKMSSIKYKFKESHVLSKLEAADILIDQEVKLCIPLNAKQKNFEFQVRPFDSKQISEEVDIKFHTLISNYFTTTEEGFILNIVSSSKSGASFIDSKYLKSNKLPDTLNEEYVKRNQILQPSPREYVEFEDLNIRLKACYIKFPPKVKGKKINLLQILDFFPMRSSVVAIMYRKKNGVAEHLKTDDQGGNMRINKVFSGNVLNDHITKILNRKSESNHKIGRAKDKLDKMYSENHLTMIVELVPDKSFIEINILSSGTIYVVYNRYTQLITSGNIKCLTHILRNVFDDLKAFSNILYEFDVDSPTIIQDDKVEVLGLVHHYSYELKFDKMKWDNVKQSIESKLKGYLFKILKSEISVVKANGRQRRKTKIDLLYTPSDLEEAEVKSFTLKIKQKKKDEVVTDLQLRDETFKYAIIEYENENEENTFVDGVNLSVESHWIDGTYDSSVFIKSMILALEGKTDDVLDGDSSRKRRRGDDKKQTNRKQTKQKKVEVAAKKDADPAAEKAPNTAAKPTAVAEKDEFIDKMDDLEQYLISTGFNVEKSGGKVNSCEDVVTRFDSEQSRLEASDPKLFAWKTNYDAFSKKTSNQNNSKMTKFENSKSVGNQDYSYDAICPNVPKVVSADEFNSNKESVLYGIRTGSDATKCKDNVYICPRYWCPNSRVSVLDPEHCSGENAVESVHIYPYFLKPASHKRGLILPCCGKRNKNYELQDGIVDSTACTNKFTPKYKKIVKNDSINQLFDVGVRHLEDLNVENAFMSAFNLENNPTQLILDKMSIRDFLLVNAGHNVRAFYDPEMKQDDKFDDFIKEKDTRTFIEDFGFNMKGKHRTDNRNMIFIIYNALVNFREYLKSDVKKIHEDFIGFAHFRWFNSSNTGVLFIEDADDTKGALKINIKKSAISSDFNNKYCCFCERDGYVTPIFGPAESGLASVKSDIVSKITDKVKGDSAADHAESILGKGKLPDKYVLDFNLRICGCVSANTFIPFDKQFNVLTNETITYAILPSVKITDQNIKSVTDKYAEMKILHESTENGGIYFPQIDYTLYASEENFQQTTPMLFDWFSPTTRKEKICSIAGMKEVQNVMDDLYYLRHQLNPMLLQDKVDYLNDIYDLSEELARCLLQVFDVDRLFEGSLKSAESGTKKIQYDPTQSDLAEIFSEYRNPYMNMFDTTLDDLNTDFVTLEI